MLPEAITTTQSANPAMGVLSLNLLGPCGCEIAKLFVSNFVSVFISQDSMTFIEFSLAIFFESPAGDMPAMCPGRRIRGITFYYFFYILPLSTGNSVFLC